MTHDVVIVGGGLAGLAAAVSLAQRGRPSLILEARARLGGRASSFTDAATGQLVDACQHVSMGCCTAFAEFAKTVGVSQYLQPQETLQFATPDRRVSRFRRDPWPAPLHLGRAFAGLHYLSASEKLRIGAGLMALLRVKPDNDSPLLAWLQSHWQTLRCIERFWNVVLTSALNAPVADLGLKYARRVFVDAFLKDREGFTVELPTVPLSMLYGEELRGWFDCHGVTVRENVAVKALAPGTAARWDVHLRTGESICTNNVILAVPFERVLDLLPPHFATEPTIACISELKPSPITSVHFWFDRDVFPWPHVVLVDMLGQWVFRRANGYLQVVVSASEEAVALGHGELERRILKEVLHLAPRLTDAKLLRSRVVTERTATFRCVPGVDANRPSQKTPWPGLFLAGDWTATGWPATMEGAVRSGKLAAGFVE